MLSNFLSIGGNLFSVGHLASKGLLQEYFRTFLLTIYNAPSLETKIMLFSEFFNKNINIYSPLVKDIPAFKFFIQEQFNNNFESYVKLLKTLSQLEIMPFASGVSQQLYNSYNTNLASLTPKPDHDVVLSTISLSNKILYWSSNRGFILRL